MTGPVELPEHAILAALIEHGVIAPSGSWRVQPLGGGLNSRVYVARQEQGGRAFTVRASSQDRAWMLEREAATLETLAGTCACAPELTALLEWPHGSGSMLLVHEHVPGGILRLETATDAQLLALGTCLAQIHSHTSDHYTVWPELAVTVGIQAAAFTFRLAAVERYASFSSRENGDLARRVQVLYRSLQQTRLAGEGWDASTYALLHGDLSLGNIIWHGDSVCLIDWEYTRAGDPAEELAYLLAEQDLPATRANLLLEEYVRAGGDASTLTRMQPYAALVALDSALWWADLDIKRGQRPGHSPEVNYHLFRAGQALNDR